MQRSNTEYGTGPEAIMNALKDLDLDKIEKEAYDGLAQGKKTARSKYVKQLNVIKGLRRTGVRPEQMMISAVPVVPPKYRPFAQQGDSLIAGDANILYKDFIEQNDAYKEEKKMFGAENTGQGRLDLYDTAKALYGYGDPLKDKSKSKDVRGFLKKIVGRTSKQGFFQSKMLAKTQDSVGRSTITANPDLDMDQLAIPYEMAFTMYAPYIQRRLKQSGMSDADAVRAVKDRTDYAKHALEEEVKTRPVIYSRAPAWWKHSILGARPVLVEGNAIGLPLVVTGNIAGDYDGDTINVHVPSTDEAVKETYETMLPSKHPYADRSGESIISKLKQEQLLGMYATSMKPTNGTYKFKTRDEALNAVKKGDIPLDAELDIEEDFNK